MRVIRLVLLSVQDCLDRRDHRSRERNRPPHHADPEPSGRNGLDHLVRPVPYPGHDAGRSARDHRPRKRNPLPGRARDRHGREEHVPLLFSPAPGEPMPRPRRILPAEEGRKARAAQGLIQFPAGGKGQDFRMASRRHRSIRHHSPPETGGGARGHHQYPVSRRQ